MYTQSLAIQWTFNSTILKKTSLIVFKNAKHLKRSLLLPMRFGTIQKMNSNKPKCLKMTSAMSLMKTVKSLGLVLVMVMPKLMVKVIKKPNQKHKAEKVIKNPMIHLVAITNPMSPMKMVKKQNLQNRTVKMVINLRMIKKMVTLSIGTKNQKVLLKAIQTLSHVARLMKTIGKMKLA